MKRVIVFSYYSPEELTGIGKYNGDFITWLVDQELKVVSITNVPFYPFWSKYKGYRNSLIRDTRLSSLYRDIRSYVYIPKNPGAIGKILSEFSFFVSSILSWLVGFREVKKSNLIVVIAPPFFLSFLPICLGKLLNIPVLSHIQDLQIDAARELGLLPYGLCKQLEKVEKFLLKKSSYVSTISSGMKDKIKRKNINNRVQIIKNWAALDSIFPTTESYWLHHLLNIDPSKKLIVYSGNIGKKQGLEIVLESAEQLESYEGLHFVILGEGIYKEELREMVKKKSLKNFSIASLVEKEDLNQMLNSSFIQLVIQKSVGADSFLPSKLTNILASGSCSIVTADEGTSLHQILKESSAGRLITPDSSEQLSVAIKELYNNPNSWMKIKENARNYALKELNINTCMAPLLKLLKD